MQRLTEAIWDNKELVMELLQVSPLPYRERDIVWPSGQLPQRADYPTALWAPRYYLQT